MVAGSELRDDPLAPISTYALRRIAEAGDDTPIEWLAPEERYAEKLATPDVSIADLLGDIDPIKAATRKLTYADPEVMHFGIVPRSNRGIFAINELPDLAPRIQVGLLNLLEERDLQIRGFPVRIPLDMLFAFSRQPRGLHQPRHASSRRSRTASRRRSSPTTRRAPRSPPRSPARKRGPIDRKKMAVIETAPMLWRRPS